MTSSVLIILMMVLTMEIAHEDTTAQAENTGHVKDWTASSMTQSTEIFSTQPHNLEN